MKKLAPNTNYFVIKRKGRKIYMPTETTNLEEESDLMKIDMELELFQAYYRELQSNTIEAVRARVLKLENILDIHPFPKYKHITKQLNLSL